MPLIGQATPNVSDTDALLEVLLALRPPPTADLAQIEHYLQRRQSVIDELGHRQRPALSAAQRSRLLEVSAADEQLFRALCELRQRTAQALARLRQMPAAPMASRRSI